MRRGSESDTLEDSSANKKPKISLSSPDQSCSINLEQVHMTEDVLGLPSECTVEYSQEENETPIVSEGSSIAIDPEYELFTEPHIEFMDIVEPLSHLRTLLERKTGRNLSDFKFFLQNSQELDASKNLVNQCVQGEGLVQINVEIFEKDGSKKINIVDVLKPAEEIPLSTSVSNEGTPRIYLLGDNSYTDGSGQEKIKETFADSQQVTRWIMSPEFRRLQERFLIPHDPTEWVEEHIKIWLEWVIYHFKIPKANIRDWRFSGKELMMMSLDDFKARLKCEANDMFWTHLELLRKFKIVACCVEKPTEMPDVKPILSEIPEDPIYIPMGMPQAKKREKFMRDKELEKDDKNKIIKRAPRIGPPKIPYEGSIGNHAGSNGQIQLWQFLLELLTDKDYRDYIQWVDNEGEFKLINPEVVAQLWGQRKNKPTMNYEKLSRALRYYYDGEMLAKVHGKRFVYKFVCDLKSLLGYDAYELNRLVKECEEKSLDSPHSTVLTYQTVESNSIS